MFVNCLTSLEHLCSLRSQPLVLKITINKCKIMINLTSFSQNSRVMRTSGLQWNREKKNTHTHTQKQTKKEYYARLGKICSEQFLVSGLCHSDYQAAANTKSPFYSYRWKQGWS